MKDIQFILTLQKCMRYWSQFYKILKTEEGCQMEEAEGSSSLISESSSSTPSITDFFPLQQDTINPIKNTCKFQ